MISLLGDEAALDMQEIELGSTPVVSLAYENAAVTLTYGRC